MALSGGAPAPAPFDPEREARAQMMLEQQREQRAEAQRAAEEQRRQAQEAQQREQFSTQLGGARGSFENRANQAFMDRGADPSQYSGVINNSIQDLVGSIPDLDPNPGSYFNDSLVDSILGSARSRDQLNYRNQFNEFAPQGFATNRIGNTMDDPILESILATQFEDANTQVRRAYDRGHLDEVGFSSAQSGLGNQRSAGQAALTGIGDSVLETGRGQLRSIADEGRSAIGSYDIGQQFDPSQYRSRIDDTFGQFTGNLEGSVRNAVGGQKFFDPTSLIGRGAVNQGVTNNSPNALAGALANREDERRQTRGLGSQGAF